MARRARYDGMCRLCHVEIKPGQMIERFGGPGNPYAHEGCVKIREGRVKIRTAKKTEVSDSCRCKRCGGDLVDLNADESACLSCGWMVSVLDDYASYWT